MTICWERAVPLAFHLCCFYFSAVLIVCVPFPFDSWGRMWKSIVSVPDHCLFIYFSYFVDYDKQSTKCESFIHTDIIYIFYIYTVHVLRAPCHANDVHSGHTSGLKGSVIL